MSWSSSYSWKYCLCTITGFRKIYFKKMNILNSEHYQSSSERRVRASRSILYGSEHGCQTSALSATGLVGCASPICLPHFITAHTYMTLFIAEELGMNDRTWTVPKPDIHISTFLRTRPCHFGLSRSNIVTVPAFGSNHYRRLIFSFTANVCLIILISTQCHAISFTFFVY